MTKKLGRGTMGKRGIGSGKNSDATNIKTKYSAGSMYKMTNGDGKSGRIGGNSRSYMGSMPKGRTTSYSRGKQK